MGDYDKKPSKSALAAGPSESDRCGTGKVQENILSRVLASQIEGGALKVTIASGTAMGTRANMKGYLKVGADGFVEFQVIEAREALSYAYLNDVTAEDITRTSLEVTINPHTLPPQPGGAIPARTLHMEVIPLGTRITVSKGTAQGVVVWTPGSLRSKEGRGSFIVTNASVTRSLAIVHEPADSVSQNREVTLNRLPPTKRGGAR